MVQSLVAPEGEFNAEQLVSDTWNLWNAWLFQVHQRYWIEFVSIFSDLWMFEWCFSFAVERSEARGINGLKITMRFWISGW